MPNIANSVRHHAKLRPDSVALTMGLAEVSYGTLDKLAAGCADRLLADGLNPGDHVLISLPNCIEWVVAYQGIVRSGAIPVPVNPLLADTEIDVIYKDCAASVIINDAPWGPERPSCVCSYDISAKDKSLVETLANSQPCPIVRPDDVAVILYSSGSTGKPKGIELTHYGLMWNAQAFALDLLDIKPIDRGYVVLPLSHVFAHTCLMTTFLFVGASLTISSRYDADETLRAIDRDRITIFMGVPAMYWTLAEQTVPDGLDLSCWRACVSGGQALPEEVHKNFEERFSVMISEGYGMTEASASICNTRLSGSRRKPGGCGDPFWGVSIRIINDEGRDVEANEKGEILVASPGLAKGYYGQPELTRTTFRNGWLHTGDIGRIDDDGTLFVIGRQKEMIISGGYNVYPREIEELGLQMPGVFEVAAIGEPHERFGETIVAYVVPKEGAKIDTEVLIDEWSAKLAKYKVPRKVRVLPSLPRNANNKIDRLRLSALYLEYKE